MELYEEITYKNQTITSIFKSKITRYIQGEFIGVDIFKL